MKGGKTECLQANVGSAAILFQQLKLTLGNTFKTLSTKRLEVLLLFTSLHNT